MRLADGWKVSGRRQEIRLYVDGRKMAAFSLRDFYGAHREGPLHPTILLAVRRYRGSLNGRRPAGRPSIARQHSKA